jgi:hypothetical protein
VKKIEVISSQLLFFFFFMDASNHFFLPTEKPCVLCPDVSVHSNFGPRLCSTLQVYSQAHWVEQFFFLNAHLLAPLEKGIRPSRTSPELALGTEKYFEALK